MVGRQSDLVTGSDLANERYNSPQEENTRHRTFFYFARTVPWLARSGLSQAVHQLSCLCCDRTKHLRFTIFGNITEHRVRQQLRYRTALLQVRKPRPQHPQPGHAKQRSPAVNPWIDDHCPLLLTRPKGPVRHSGTCNRVSRTCLCPRSPRQLLLHFRHNHSHILSQLLRPQYIHTRKHHRPRPALPQPQTP